MLKEDLDIVTMSKYPEARKANLSWFQGDIFNLEDVEHAMEGIDFAIYYLDPTKRSSKTTEATFTTHVPLRRIKSRQSSILQETQKIKRR